MITIQDHSLTLNISLYDAATGKHTNTKTHKTHTHTNKHTHTLTHTHTHTQVKRGNILNMAPGTR